ncbi:MAG: MFS transporter [Spirochaetales bacterium]|nr:MFS transporter [Spirochaetales bacterium]
MIQTEKYQEIKMRVLYWVVFTAFGAWIPFSSLYFKQVLVTQDGSPAVYLIGLIMAIQPFLGIFSNPIAGFLSDKFKIGQRLLFLCSLLTAIGALFISIPGFPLFRGWLIEQKYPAIGVGIIIMGLFVPPIIPVLNTEMLNFLHNNNRDPRFYGTYRAMGTISWIVTTILTGLFLGLTGLVNLPPLIYAAGLLILAVITLRGIKAKVEKVSIPWHYLAGDTLFIKFLIFSFFQGFGLLSGMYFTSYFLDDINLPYLFIGMAWAISAIPEVPVMFLSRHISRRIGNRMMVIAGTGFLTLKFILLVAVAPLRLPYLSMLAMSLHGIGYGLQFNGMIHLIDGYAHKDLRATYMNIFNIVGISLASACGNMFGAFIIEKLDSTRMLAVNAGIVILSIVYFVFFVEERDQRIDKGHDSDNNSR